MPEYSDILIAVQLAAQKGANVGELITVIKTMAASEKLTPFAVTSVLTDAFGISLRIALHVGGARCMGGMAYSDAEIDAIILPAINAARPWPSW